MRNMNFPAKNRPRRTLEFTTREMPSVTNFLMTFFCQGPLAAEESLVSKKALSRDFAGFSRNAEITNFLKIANLS